MYDSVHCKVQISPALPITQVLFLARTSEELSIMCQAGDQSCVTMGLS